VKNKFHESICAEGRSKKMENQESRPAKKFNVREILNFGGENLIVWDTNGVIFDISLDTVEFFGVQTKEDFYKKNSELQPEFQPNGENSKEAMHRRIKHALESGASAFNWVYKKLNNRHMDCRVEMYVGNISGKKVVCSFITEQFVLEEKEKTETPAAPSTSDRIHVMLDAVPIGCWLYTCEGVAIDCNQHAVDMLGMSSKGELNSSSVEACTPPLQNTGETSREYFTRIFMHTAKEGIFRGPFTAQTKQGRKVHCDLTLLRVEYNGEHAIMAALRETDEDFELMRQIKAERATQKRMEAMLDSAPHFCAIFNENAIPIDVSQAGARIFGFSEKHEYLENFHLLAPPFQPCGTPSFELVKRDMKKVLETGEVHINPNFIHKHPDGSEIPCEVTLVSAELEGKNRVIAHARDLREHYKLLAQQEAAFAAKARMEIAEESNQAKSRFLARMSHEIRTPITAVLGISEIELQNPNHDTHTGEAFARIHSSAKLLLGIINDILDLSKIEAGKMKVFLEKYCTASMISDVAHLNLINLGNKHLKFNLSVDENLPKFLIGDVIRIEQIINNLLSNAFKYTESGSVELALAWENALLISVKDTGPGMAPEQLNALEKNEYVRFHENRVISGTGLGMPIVYSLSHIMNAEVKIKSQPGEGTQVDVRIPQESSGAGILGAEAVQSLQNLKIAAGPVMRKFQFNPERMSYGRVLVVDDVEANLFVAKGLLAFYDLQVETCDSGFQAIEKIRAGNTYDIIFMDYMMPTMNGTETMNILRDMGYDSPVVVLTANALIGQSEEFLNAGFDGFISKPIQTKQLNAILIKHVRCKKPPDSIDDFQNDTALQEKLRLDFMRGQKNTFAEISQALALKNTENALLLAHSLKGLAGLINETALMHAAEKVELMINDGKTPDTEAMHALEKELSLVLESIKAPEPENAVFDKTDATKLFGELEMLLASRNAACVDLIPQLKKIPETAVLCAQIEEYDFETAKNTFKYLRKIFEI